MTDDDQQDQNGEHPGAPTDPGAPGVPAFSPPQYPPTAPVAPPPLGVDPFGAGAIGSDPPEPAAPPPGSAPPTYPPGYPPPPGVEPTYQAPAPWVPPSYATSPTSPTPSAFGPPPVPPVAGAALSNGSGHDPSERRRRRRILTIIVPIVVVAFVLGVVGVAVFGGSTSTVGTPPSTASPAARQLLQSALTAADGASSFHYVSVSSLAGPNGGTQRTVGDAGPDSGKQVITAGNQKFTVLVVGTACYLKGNAAALVANLGVLSATATAHAGQWISLARTDGPYASVYAAVTAHSAITDNITVVPKTQLPTTREDGRRVQTVSGAIAPIRIAGQLDAPKGTATLSVRATSPHLPVRYTERGTLNREQSTSVITFSHWGETVNIAAPTGAVAFASLGTGSGSGSTPSTPGGPVIT